MNSVGVSLTLSDQPPCAGIPLFFLELSLGQWFQQGAFGTFRKIHPAFGGIGLASGVCTFLVGVYYQVIIGWGIFYL